MLPADCDSCAQQAFGTSSGTPNGQCYIQGYPGSRADSVGESLFCPAQPLASFQCHGQVVLRCCCSKIAEVAFTAVSGPVTVTVPAGSNLTVFFTKGSNTYFQVHPSKARFQVPRASTHMIGGLKPSTCKHSSKAATCV